MKEYNLGGHKVKVYDSIEELPVVRFHKYNKFLLMDAGMGSDMNDVEGKIARAQAFINRDMKSEALLELHNLRNTLYLISTGINLKHLAFSALIHSIDGKEITDISDENLSETLKQLNTVKVSALDRLIESVKKKISQEMSVYFPDTARNTDSLNSFADMMHIARLQLDYVINERDHDDEVEEISLASMTKDKPRIFMAVNSEEVKHDKKFDELCLYISKNCNVPAKKMTVLEFYNSLNYLKTKK